VGDPVRGSAVSERVTGPRCAMAPGILAVLLVVLAVTWPSRSASSQVLDARDSTLRLNVLGDIVAIGVSVLAWQFPPTLEGAMTWRAPHLMDRSRVNAFDRIATRQWSPAAGTASDVFLYGGLGGAFVASGIEALVHKHTARKWVIQGVVMAESILVASGLTTIAKYAVRRPRPTFYNPAAPDSERAQLDANKSFWSGHAATVAAALASYATVEWLEEPGSMMAWVSTAAAAAVIPTVASLRVAAGKHYPSDVIVGGLVGAATGIVVPLLHRWRPAGKASTLRVDPLALQGGAGAAASMAW